MIQIASWRAIAGGFAAGAIGLAVFSAPLFSAPLASADPLAPAPAPAIPTPGAPAQNGAAAGAPNRIIATPPAPNAFLPSTPAPAAGAPGAAAAAPMPPSVTPAVSGTLRDYFQAKGVKLEAQKPQGFKALDVTLPVPPRWTQVPDPNVPDAFAVIADRQGNSVYTSNAQVVVYKLVGNVDPKEAITHGYADSQKLLGWRTTSASTADFDGFPSSLITGMYREGDMTLNTSRRNVIATSGRDKYLVSMSVTTDRSLVAGDAPATSAIINGFRVAVPGAPAPATAPAAQAPATAPAPAALPAQAPARAPAAIPAQTPATAPAALPGQTPGVPAQAAVTSQTSSSQGIPNLLALVPGLPPLPNINLGGPQR
jgi:hypothetical protein